MDNRKTISKSFAYMLIFIVVALVVAFLFVKIIASFADEEILLSEAYLSLDNPI